jgi:hypothetical protein
MGTSVPGLSTGIALGCLFGAVMAFLPEEEACEQPRCRA